MLNTINVKFELIPYPDMYLFFERSIRDGVSYISKRYSKANNNLKFYDPKQDSKHIIYVDANNVYSYAMSKFLSTNGFVWIDPKEFEYKKYTSNSSKGCVLKVDLEYPKELRKLHNDHSIAPDKIEIKREMLSDY